MWSDIKSEHGPLWRKESWKNGEIDVFYETRFADGNTRKGYRNKNGWHGVAIWTSADKQEYQEEKWNNNKG